MITVIRAPAYATVQDCGRPGYRRDGVPPGGAMDPAAITAGNALLGNEPGAAGIEWALTGGQLRFVRSTSFALTGTHADARLGDERVPFGAAHEARAGDVLTIEKLEGRFLYICLTGGIDVPPVLGSRSTYLPGGFGGLEGRRLRKGDVLQVGTSAPACKATTPQAASPPVPAAVRDDAALALLPGPDVDEIGSNWNRVLDSTFTVSASSDRLGYRLEGPRINGSGGADRLSEPACPGAIQLTPKGELIVLMPDGPTVGGYPKIGVVASADLGRLAQRMPGEPVRFRQVDFAEAIGLLNSRGARTGDAARSNAARLHSLDSPAE